MRARVSFPLCLPKHTRLAPSLCSCKWRLAFALAGSASMAKRRAKRASMGAKAKAQASRKLAAAKKAADKTTFKPVTCQLGYVVKGGFGAGRPQAVNTVEYGNEHFVRMHKMESWVCHAVAGKAKGLNPLRRARALETIADLISEVSDEKAPPALAPAGPRKSEDSLWDLGLDGPSALAPAGHDDSAGRKRKTVAKPMTRKCQALTLSLPRELRDGQRRHLRVLTRAPGERLNRSHVWVSTDDVPWVLATLHRQWASGGVEFCPEPVQQRKPYFQIRDRSWQVRARLPSGEYKRKSFCVPWSTIMPDGKRAFISQAQFAEDKEAMFQKAVAWQIAVEEGVDPDN